MDAREVEISYKDYRDGARVKKMRLGGVEFIRRFLQHVAPAGFRRIRYYGWLATQAGREQLVKVQAACLMRLGAVLGALEAWAAEAAEKEAASGGRFWPCPVCGEGTMVWARRLGPIPEDTS